MSGCGTPTADITGVMGLMICNLCREQEMNPQSEENDLSLSHSAVASCLIKQKKIHPKDSKHSSG